MKKLQIIAYVIFIIGLITKLFHVNGSNYLLVLGTLLILIYGILFFFKNRKEKLADSLMHLAISFLTVYLFCRLLFMYCGPMILGLPLYYLLSLGISIPALIMNVSKRTNFKLPQVLFLFYFLFISCISFLHSYRIYYFLNLNEITAKECRIENYRMWDRYSWYLYLGDKQEEAIDANQKAQQIIEEKLKIEQIEQLLNDLETIKNHNLMIRDQNWTDNQ